MNKQPYIIVCLIGLWLLPMLTWAQKYPKLSITDTKRVTKYYRQLRAEVQAEQSYLVQLPSPVTGLALRAILNTDWKDTYLTIGQDTFRIQGEEHETEGLAHNLSVLLVWDVPIQGFILHSGQMSGDMLISLFNAQADKSSHPVLRQERSDKDQLSCQKPSFISQEEWRSGLPAPSYQRAITQVNHVIIHHSATFNSLTDYENVVRNMYLFHTQDRGWSDIGYNFLVAPDGTLFEGRSAGTQNVASDDIRGAHFCGRNSGTMGVCLLGNYNTATPTDAALATIVQVTSWKLDKEGLNPLATNNHPTNRNLGVVAGHRNGCATECPGENLYARLEDIRLNTEQQIAKGCQEEPQVFNLHPVPSDGLLTITLPEADSLLTLEIINLQGKTLSLPVESDNLGQFVIATQNLPAGSYIVRLTTLEGILTRKISVE
ncbi:MAG: N-acetylmuramoyl-L-alanine amidase [Bacteroidota bacterium]